MRIQSIAAVVVTSLFVLAANRASADFQWLGTWQGTTTGTGLSSFTPGADLPLGGSVSGSASVSIGPSGSQQAEITMTRSFSLSGSPGGWLLNSASSQAIGTESGASVVTSAVFISEMIDQQTIVSSGQSFPTFGNGPYIIFATPIKFLTDGVHSLQFYHRFDVNTGPGASAFCSASDTFNFPFSVTPIPEPEYLMGFCALALAGCFVRRRLA